VYIKHREVELLGSSLTGLELGKPPVSLGVEKVVSLQWVSDLSADYANAPHLTGRWRPGEPVICYW
jgi:hypothetical protein